MAAGTFVTSWFGKTTSPQETNSSGENHRAESRKKSALTLSGTSRQKASSEQGQETIRPLYRDDPATLQSPNLEVVKRSSLSHVAPARVSIAAALYASLPESAFQKMDAHAQAVILELGAYAQQEATVIDSTHPSETFNPTREKERVTAEADAFLRMSLGHERFNELSSLAAANRDQQMLEPTTSLHSSSK